MELQDNVFYTPTQFAELRNCSVPTALSIYNSQGQEVMNIPSYSGGELVKHSFVPGIYTVHIQTTNRFSRLKLLVL